MWRRSRPFLVTATGAITGALAALAVPTEGPLVAERDRPTPQAAVARPATVTTLLVWTPGRLPPGFARDIRALAGVEAVAAVRSGTAWLTGWRAPDGRRGGPPPGLAVPVEVSAVRPSYGRFVPPGDRASVEGLAPGEAVLGRSAASIRGLGAGSTLHVGGTSLRVTEVLPDELIGAAEVLVSIETGKALNVVRPRYLLVDLQDDVGRERVERRIRGRLPPGTRARVRGPGETPVFRHGDAVLPQVQLKKLFGEFAAAAASGGTLRIDPVWVERNIRSARVPVLGEVRCHRTVIPALRAALEEIERRGLDRLIDPTDYGGCFSPRFINRNPGTGLSHHSWGIAFDINVSENGLGRDPRLDPRVVTVFERAGFAWGGRWLVPDGMHFEYVGIRR